MLGVVFLAALCLVVFEPPVARSTGTPLSLSASGEATCAVTVLGEPYCWGHGARGAVGNGYDSGDFPLPQHLVDLDGVTTIAEGGSHGCALHQSGHVYCWGDANFGQIAVGGTCTSEGDCWRNTPGAAQDIAGPVAALDAGQAFTCALLIDASVQCWGLNDRGQLGAASAEMCSVTLLDPEFACSATPLTVQGLPASALAVSLGAAHSCALLLGDDVYCWGANAAGQLGNGTMTDSQTPVAVGGLPSGIAGIDAGGDNTCVWTVAGDAWCWGSDEFGQLTDGVAGGSSATPVVISQSPGVPDDGIDRVSAGSTMCALKDDTTLSCWGHNNLGQIGDGTQNDALYPVQVPNLTAVGLATGRNHTCAIDTAAMLLCWGSNSAGQIGNGSYAGEIVVEPFAVQLDSDGDGCLDEDELQTTPGSEMFGGRRNPKNPWDFYDTTGDGTVDLLNDIFGVAGRFGSDADDIGPGEPDGYLPVFDRSAPVPGDDPWDMQGPDGVVDLFTDVFGAAFQFGHRCSGSNPVP